MVRERKKSRGTAFAPLQPRLTQTKGLCWAGTQSETISDRTAESATKILVTSVAAAAWTPN